MFKKLNIILIFIGLALSMNSLNAKEIVEIKEGDVIKLIFPKNKPTYIKTSFFIDKITPLNQGGKEASPITKVTGKDIIVIPTEKMNVGSLIITNNKKQNYYIQYSVGDGDTDISLIDYAYLYDNQKGNSIKFETDNLKRDAKRIFIAIDNNKKLTGFKFQKSNFVKFADSKEYKMKRYERLFGKKYVLDRWVLKNLTKKSLNFIEEDFATKGLLIVSLSSPTVPVNGMISVDMLLSKKAISDIYTKTSEEKVFNYE
jgi:hypothetical protein